MPHKLNSIEEKQYLERRSQHMLVVAVVFFVLVIVAMSIFRVYQKRQQEQINNALDNYIAKIQIEASESQEPQNTSITIPLR